MLFEALNKIHSREQELQTGGLATLIAKQRIDYQLGAFIKNVTSDEEFTTRVAYVKPRMLEIVSEACQEAGATHPEHVVATIEKIYSTEQDDHQCPHCKSHNWTAQGEKQGGLEGKCDKCGKRFFLDLNDASVRKDITAASEEEEEEEEEHANDGKPPWLRKKEEHEARKVAAPSKADLNDSYWKEMVKPQTSEDGYAWSQEGSPKIDKSRVPEDGLKPIDVPSKEHPLVRQDVEQHEQRKNLTGDEKADPTEAPFENVDIEKTIGDTAAIPTKTFGQTPNHADPVTNVSLSKWHFAADMPSGGPGNPLDPSSQLQGGGGGGDLSPNAPGTGQTNFQSAEEFINYLRSTLIPDLQRSGSEATAEDFEEAVHWIEQTKGDQGGHTPGSQPIPESPPGVSPMGPETAGGGLTGQQPY